MSVLATEILANRCRSIAAHCAAIYPRYGERGGNLARGCTGERSRRGGVWLEIAAIGPEKNPMGGRGFSGFRRSTVAAGVAAGLMAVLGVFLVPRLAAASVR